MAAGFPDNYTQLWGHTLAGDVLDADTVYPSGVTAESPLEEVFQFTLESAGDSATASVYGFLKETGGAINPAILADIGLGDYITTAAYWENTDLGGATYRVVAAATGTVDGGLYIDAGSFQLEAVFGEQINIAQFGAQTGGFDNATILDSVRDAAGSSYRIVIPRGRWHKTGRWAFSGPAVIFGTDWEAELVQDSDDICILFQDLVTEIVGAHVANLSIDMNGNGQLDAGALIFNNCYEFLADRVHIQDAGTPNESNPQGCGGISVSSGSTAPEAPTSTGTVRDCLVERTTKAGYSATYGASHVDFVGCVARDNTGNGSTPGFQINGGADCRMFDCLSQRTEGAGFIIGVNGQGVAPARFTLTGCTSEDAGTLGAQSANGHGFHVANGGFISTDAAVNGAITDCVAMNAEQNGFAVQNLSSVVLDGNRSIDSRLHGFLVEGTTGTINDIAVFSNVAVGHSQGGLATRGIDGLKVSQNVLTGGGRGLWFVGAATNIRVIDNHLHGTVKSVDFTTTPTNIEGMFNVYDTTTDLSDTITETPETGVTVDAAGIHAALVNLGLITA